MMGMDAPVNRFCYVSGMKSFLFPFLLFAASTLCLGDTVRLKNGSVITGTLVSINEEEVKIRTGNSVAVFLRADVASVQTGNPASKPKDNTWKPEDQQVPTRPDGPPPSSEHGVLAPSGTQLVVRMIDGVDSRKDAAGQTYRATLEDPLQVDGREVLRKGTDVKIRMIDLKKSGKISGRTTLTLDLVSIRYKDRWLQADAADVQESSGSRGKKSALVVGGVAALGAVIGGLAGGGKGAAVGAASGAGAGGAIQVLTKGEQVKVPSESVLRFTLDKPLRY